ncbi:MAG: DUF177 domain-containing protein [Victivallales bacterium]|nr:DUF177 domain-containing protein [Victivallales bacterium]
MLTISLKGIDNAGKTFSGEVSSEALSLDDASRDDRITFDKPVKYSLHVSEVSDGILVAGTLATTLRIPCSRCLEPFEYDIKLDDVCHFLENSNNDIVEVSEELREDILVSLPVRFICKENCAGLCVGCGENLNKGKCDCESSKSQSAPLSPWDALDQLRET